ncbi:MAG TPA: hypothetical protein PK079_02665 [Leptospiraceae bacterium]|nr:hypothetical protein [Leptospiraceae bacterium]HMW04109.1 hypothetical protein [Leptospiraceae bacterium]HMX30824.1 hypothetical protein [Leptospiraceae bacterium]HMY30102.1 hypothetical protein [Leptospiraceae bacterium]HMZ65460.1 hypothetical protein [Leptospiraceae bacterium]
MTDLNIPNDSKENIFSKLKSSLKLTEPILNGIFGNYLEESGNELAIKPGFYYKNKIVDQSSINDLYSELTPNLLIFVHGLACDETYWSFKEESGEKNSFGEILSSKYNFTSLYFRYNTGRHISDNGNILTDTIEKLVSFYPKKIESINLITHSMGGLVTRSACYYGEEKKQNWLKYINQIFLIGSPHLGAPLEKFGNIVTNVFTSLPQSYMKLAGDVINQRSSGIKDLRYGSILEEDWKDKEEDALLVNNRTDIPIYENAKYYIVSGSIHKNPKSVLNHWFGDAMVRKKSSRGEGIFDQRDENFFEFPGIDHIQLGHSKEVLSKLEEWLLLENKQLTLTNKKELSNLQEEEKSITKEQMVGLSKLVEKAIAEGAKSVEEVQKELTSKPYDILSKIFPGIQLTEKIKDMHNTANAGIYKSIQVVNEEINKIARKMLKNDSNTE